MVELKLKKSDIQRINKKLLESLQNYRKMVSYMSADVPVGVLCLPKDIEKILINQGFLRVYDLIGTDLTKIKGIGKIRIRNLTTRLDEFLAVR